MGPISEHHLMLFLLQFALLLGACKLLGYVFHRFNQSTVTAEILVGIIFGPAILGRLAPAVYNGIFPDNQIQRSMLETVAWFGNFFLLLETGLEVNFSRIWAQKGDAVKLSFADLLLPVLISFVPIYLLPDRYLVNPEQRIIFALFIASIMTISALSISIRGLRDLNILKSDLGFLVISALTLNDIVGWVLFVILLGIFEYGSFELSYVAKLISLTLLFTLLSMTLLRKWVDRGMSFIHVKIGKETGYKTTFMVLIGMIFGAITLKIGIHSLFGFFIAGIVLGEARHASEKDRYVVNRMVNSIFVPIFFANIGLHLNFVENFDLLLVSVMTGVGIFARFTGAYLGAKWAKQDKDSLSTIAICHTPGGEMHIVVGMLAYSSGLISSKVFVSIIASAILSTIFFGPWLSKAVAKMQKLKLRILFRVAPGMIDERSHTREEALMYLTDIIARDMPHIGDTIKTAVNEREGRMSTAIGKEIAIPHARLEGIDRAYLYFMKTKYALEWESIDELPVHDIFMILTPADKPALQIRILSVLAKQLANPLVRERLQDSNSPEQVMNLLEDSFISCKECLIER